MVTTGQLRAFFDSEQKLDVLEFVTESHEEYVSRKMVIAAARPTHSWTKQWKKMNGQESGSPELNKKGKAKAMKSPNDPPPDFTFPHSAVKGNMGITEPVFQFLEVRLCTSAACVKQMTNSSRLDCGSDGSDACELTFLRRAVSYLKLGHSILSSDEH